MVRGGRRKEIYEPEGWGKGSQGTLEGTPFRGKWCEQIMETRGQLGEVRSEPAVSKRSDQCVKIVGTSQLGEVSFIKIHLHSVRFTLVSVHTTVFNTLQDSVHHQSVWTFC